MVDLDRSRGTGEGNDRAATWPTGPAPVHCLHHCCLSVRHGRDLAPPYAPFPSTQWGTCATRR